MTPCASIWGLFQHDVNVIWDLAVHDLSIMDYLLRDQPCAVSATGMSHVAGQPENIAYLTLFFNSNLIAHVHINWLAPVKMRRTLIGGSQQMIVYDDIEPSEKVKVYDKGIILNGKTLNGHNGNGHNGNGHNGHHVNGHAVNGHAVNGHHGSEHNTNGRYQMLVDYRAGDMWAPQLAMTEALSTEAAHFLECIQSSKAPLTDGEAGPAGGTDPRSCNRIDGGAGSTHPPYLRTGDYMSTLIDSPTFTVAPAAFQEANRIVKAVHGLHTVNPDPAFEIGLSQHLRETYDRDALLALYPRFATGDGDFEMLMRPRAVACDHAPLRSWTTGWQRCWLQTYGDLPNW